MPTNRRSFLAQAAVGSVAVGSVGAMAITQARTAQASDRLKIGIIGCGGRSSSLIGILKTHPTVEIAYVCDPDQSRLAKGAQESANPSVKAVGDLRTILDDKEVDAVVIATPDHWHAPAAILACDAGKHVYVEKPCSHNVREGRLLVDAARRNKRVVQHGTQVRSTRMMQDGTRLLKEGIIGTVLVARVWNIQRRGTIGHAKPSAVPKGFDYETWLGMVPEVPYQANRVHGGWHWWYDFGTGDMGNDGVHDLDYGRWGLGVETHPTRITALGGKYVFDDDQQFPDTQQVTFEYGSEGKSSERKLLIYEQRLWSTNYPYNCDSGVEFQGTKGMMFLSRRGKIQVSADRNARLDVKIPGEEQNAPAHVANFLDAVRDKAKANGEIEIGHLTSSLAHLGNVATRLGRTLKFNPALETIEDDEEASQLLTRTYREGHWATPKTA